MQAISEDQIKALRSIFQKDFGKDLDETTAKSMASWLLNYFKLIVDIEKEKL